MGVHSDTECTKVGVGILVEGSQSMMSDGMLVDEQDQQEAGCSSQGGGGGMWWAMPY